MSDNVKTHQLPIVEAAEKLLAEARGVLVDGVEETLQTAASELVRYDGLPIRNNVLQLTGTDQSEVVYTKLLTWLLDSTGSHGLGDSVLRGLLALSGDALVREFAGQSSQIPAVVRNEVPVGNGYLDVCVALRGIVIALEAKIWAPESKKKYLGTRVGQTTYYRRNLENDETRHRSLTAMGERAVRLAGVRPHIVSMFLRPAGSKAANHPKGQADLHSNITWLDIDRILAAAMVRGDPAEDAVPLLRSLRSSIVATTGARDPLLSEVVSLRAWLDNRELRRCDPVAAYIRLSALSSGWNGSEG